jgi:peptidoglycan L-alanyl-D-glutamate endopeptidase CwlK
LDSVSERNLATIAPALAQKIRSAAAKLEEQNIHICVYSGLRTAAEQDALYAKGRQDSGHVVTNAKAGQSMHNYGLAADIVPFLSDADDANTLNWNPVSANYKAMVAALKAEGLEWGGDWIHFKDLDHFQMQGLPANPTPLMISEYSDGTDLKNIWQNAAEGKYA